MASPEERPEPAAARARPGDAACGGVVVFVTGPSGAGRSTAVKALEDIGFEAIDNLPLSLVPRLLSGPPLERPVALGIDVRNREFSVEGMLDLVREIGMGESYRTELLYLDCRPDVLVRRYSETRRRHPLASHEAPAQAIEREIGMLAPVRAKAHTLIETSDLTPHELRAELERLYGGSGRERLSVAVQSFSYKRGIPRGVDMVLDCRFLRNPYWEPALRARDGRDPAVAAHVEGDPRFAPYLQQIESLLKLLLPAICDEGKAHFSIAFGCTGGQHRSVLVAEKVAKMLAAEGWQVSKRHRELERPVGP